MQEFDPFRIALTGVMPFALLIACFIAYPLSLWLLKRYHKAVLKAMLKDTHPDFLDTKFDVKEIAGNISEIKLPGDNEESSDVFFNRLINRPWRAGRIHLAGGIVFSVCMATTTSMLADGHFYIFRLSILFLVYLWPTVISISLVSAGTRQHNLIIFGLYALLFFTLTYAGVQRSPTSSWYDLIRMWCFTNLPASIFLLVFLRSKIRAVGPLVFTFLSLSIFGVFFLPTFVGSVPFLFKPLAGLLIAAGFSVTAIFIFIFLLGFILFALLGWATLRKIKSRYKNKKISDQSITIDSIWVIFGLAYSIDLIFTSAYWILACLVAIVCYKIIVAAGNRKMNRQAKNNERMSLLFLRVFSLGSRSKHLFDHVSKYWRFAGSIHLISGPDLATTTIEPHEFLDYLTGKLSRRFISNQKELAIRLSEIDNKPDTDGRYRVNDFFCYNDTWKTVLLHLVNRSKVVMMDVRSFCLQNKGCEYEIQELINMIPIEKIVFITDKTTDSLFLKNTIQQSFKRLSPASPNKAERQEDIRIFNFSDNSNRTFKKLLKTLCDAASKKESHSQTTNIAVAAF